MGKFNRLRVILRTGSIAKYWDQPVRLSAHVFQKLHFQTPRDLQYTVNCDSGSSLLRQQCNI